MFYKILFLPKTRADNAIESGIIFISMRLIQPIKALSGFYRKVYSFGGDNGT